MVKSRPDPDAQVVFPSRASIWPYPKMAPDHGHRIEIYPRSQHPLTRTQHPSLVFVRITQEYLDESGGPGRQRYLTLLNVMHPILGRKKSAPQGLSWRPVDWWRKRARIYLGVGLIRSLPEPLSPWGAWVGRSTIVNDWVVYVFQGLSRRDGRFSDRSPIYGKTQESP